MKKVVSIFLATAMLGGLLAGCGNAEVKESQEGSSAQSGSVVAEPATTPEVKEEPVTVIMRTRCANDVSDMDRVMEYVNELLLEKANIQLELQLASNITEMNQMTELSFASGEKFDILWMNSNTYSKYATEGSIIPLDDLLVEYAPELLETIDQKYFDLSEVNGQKYAVPCQQIMVTYYGYMIQKQYFDEYGKLPTHLEEADEIYPFLDWLVEKHPEVYPVYSSNLNAVVSSHLNRTNVPGTPELFVSEDDPYTVHAVHDEMVGFVWYQKEKGWTRADEGTGVDQSADLAANKYVVLCDQSRPGIEAEYKVKKGVEWVNVSVGEPMMTGTSVQATLLGVPYTSEHPEAAVKLLNLLFTDAEVFNALMYGIEGVHYVKDPDCDTHVKTVKNSGWTAYLGGWAFGNQFLMYTYDDQSTTQWADTKALNDAAKPSVLRGFKFDSTGFETEVAQVAAVRAEYKTADSFEDYAAKNAEMMDKMEKAGLSKLIEEVERQIAEYLK